MTITIFLSSNLRFLRERFQMCQKSMAQVIGKKKSVIGSYEGGIVMPTLSTLAIFCKYFGVSLDDLVLTDLKEETAILRGALDLNENRFLQTLMSKTQELVTSDQVHYDGLSHKELLKHVKELDVVVKDLSRKEMARNKIVAKLVVGYRTVLIELDEAGKK